MNQLYMSKRRSSRTRTSGAPDTVCMGGGTASGSVSGPLTGSRGVLTARAAARHAMQAFCHLAWGQQPPRGRATQHRRAPTHTGHATAPLPGYIAQTKGKQWQRARPKNTAQAKREPMPQNPVEDALARGGAMKAMMRAKQNATGRPGPQSRARITTAAALSRPPRPPPVPLSAHLEQRQHGLQQQAVVRVSAEAQHGHAIARLQAGGCGRQGTSAKAPYADLPRPPPSNTPQQPPAPHTHPGKRKPRPPTTPSLPGAGRPEACHPPAPCAPAGAPPATCPSRTGSTAS